MRVWLYAEQGNLAGQDVPLDQPALSVGRGEENDLVLQEHGVSRRHARIQRVSQGWVLTDLGSTNGTFVNGQRIGESYLLRPGDRLAIGSCMFEVRQAAGAESPSEAPESTPWISGPQRSLVMILGALLLVVVLVGVVILLVSALRPKETPGEATATGDIPGLMTVVPVPTALQDMVTSIVPMIPIFPAGPTETPEPGASNPGPAHAGQLVEPLAPTREADASVRTGVEDGSP
ncbi:FHA domain-containing protein [Chloroflexota bacterium]